MFSKCHFLFFLAVFFFLSREVNAQVIKGVILDYETDSTIAFANVYFNSSMHGTTSDQNGQFLLSTKGYDGQDIVVSCIGYDTWLIKDFHDNKFYKVYLKPSSQLLREVVIVVNDMPRKKKEGIFLREFLGTSAYASRCTIENIDDIVFTYYKSSKTLEAYCDKPLIIKNRALGYKIKYYLDDFKKGPDNMFYQGYFMFEEDTSLNMREKEVVLNRRKKAYSGSRMHFFRELWRKSSYKLQYYMQNAITDEELSVDSLVSEVYNNERCLKPFAPIKIYYKSDISYIRFIDENCVAFAKSGFFNSEFILWDGKMAEQRIGDLLPFEYWPYW